MTSLEFLKEIEAWLSFNQNPSENEVKNMKNDIKIHIKEVETNEKPALNIADVSCICDNQKCRHEYYEVWFVDADTNPFEEHSCECIKCGVTKSLI